MPPTRSHVYFINPPNTDDLDAPDERNIFDRELAHGRRAGFLSALGIHLGGLVQVAAVALGATAVLDTSPLAFRLLKAAGGAYLIWLGVERLRRPHRTCIPATASRHVLLSSAMIELSNPKSALFYLAFLLQFVAPGADLATGWQILLLGIGANLLFSIADVVGVVSAHALRSVVMTCTRATQFGYRLAGWLFIGLGAYAIVGH